MLHWLTCTYSYAYECMRYFRTREYTRVCIQMSEFYIHTYVGVCTSSCRSNWFSTLFVEESVHCGLRTGYRESTNWITEKRTSSIFEHTFSGKYWIRRHVVWGSSLPHGHYVRTKIHMCMLEITNVCPHMYKYVIRSTCVCRDMLQLWKKSNRPYSMQ